MRQAHGLIFSALNAVPSVFSRQAMAYTSSVYILAAASALIESGWFTNFVPGQPSDDSQYPEAMPMVCMA